MTWPSCQYVHANSNPYFMPVNNEHSKSHANQHRKNKNNGLLRNPCPSPRPGGQHQPSPTMPPFHVYSPFPTSDPRSHPILEVSQFEYLGLILDSKLTMHLATVEAIRRASQGQALALAISYSLLYDKNSSQLTTSQNLGLWKSIVLPHFLQNLRYIHSDTDIKKMQTSLNLSLARVLQVYGDHNGLLADTGIPPLRLTRYVDLAQLHFRLTITRPDTLHALLFHRLNSSLPLHNLHTSTLDYHIRYPTHAFKVDLQTEPLPDLSSQPTKNRESTFRNKMKKRISTLWRGELYNAARTYAGQSPRAKGLLHLNFPRRFATPRPV